MLTACIFRHIRDLPHDEFVLPSHPESLVVRLTLTFTFTAQTCGLTTQLYLIHRVYKLSRNWMIAVFLILCSLLAWSSCVATMIALMFVFKALEQRGNLITYVSR